MPGANYSAMSVEELKKEIARRQRALPQLIARKEALDKLIVALQELSDVQAAPKRLRKSLGKKHARRTQGGMRAGGLADKLAEVFQSKKSGSLAEEILLRNKNRLCAAMDVFKDRQALKLSAGIGDDHTPPVVDQNGPAPGPAEAIGRERAALSTNRAGTELHLADENGEEHGALGVAEVGLKMHSAEGNAKAPLLRAVTYEDVFAPRMK